MIKIILIAVCVLILVGMLCLDFVISKNADGTDDKNSSDSDKKSNK